MTKKATKKVTKKVMAKTAIALVLDSTAAVRGIQKVLTHDIETALTRKQLLNKLYNKPINARWTDFVAATTGFNKTEWDTVKLAIKSSFQNPEKRRIALLSKADYKAELSKLKGKAAADFTAHRNRSHTDAGKAMTEYRDEMLKRDPVAKAAFDKAAAAAEKKKAAKKKKAAAAATLTAEDRDQTESPEPAGKTGKEKILEQLRNIDAIIHNDNDPQYYLPAVQDALRAIQSLLD